MGILILEKADELQSFGTAHHTKLLRVPLRYEAGVQLSRDQAGSV